MSSSTAVRPQDDLYRAVNGAWLDQVEIPADQSMYGAFIELRDEAEAAARGLAEESAALAEAAPGSPEQLIGDLYRSFLDLESVEQLGLEPFSDQLAMISAAQTPPDLIEVIAKLERDGVSGVFHHYVDTDPAQPDRYVLNLLQGGLGLPDESFYREERYAPIRQSYVEHVERMLELGGTEQAARRAAATLRLETDIAVAHWDRVRSRDRDQTNNPMSRAELDELLPAAWWSAWLTGAQAGPHVLSSAIVRQPSFFGALPDLLVEQRLDDWKSWLTFHLLRWAAPIGPTALVDENFGFYGRVLSGTPQLRERWKRGVAAVESCVGEALGRLYVERYFPPAAKQRMDELVGYLIAAYRQEIQKLPWMSETTKIRALEKLAAFTPKVGYPAEFRTYEGLVLRADDLAGNIRRSSAFEADRQLAKIGGPVDRSEWFMTPQTVNAYYNPGMNEIVFPAAILRPPFFDPAADDATNFGGIGAVIGHEIGHGFDDQGSKVDGTGAQVDWWTVEDRAAFDALTAAVIAQYSDLEPAQLPGHKVNGALTVGENIGDLGGLGIAYHAWLLARRDAGLAGDGSAESVEPGADAPAPSGTAEDARRLFTSWALIWRAKGRDEEVLRRLAIDPHSPPEFRCNQVVRNLDEFHAAFDVQPTDALWLGPERRVRIW